MSFYDYQASLCVSADDMPFYGLVMAAMRQADTWNLALLQAAFPAVWAEMEARHDAPGGALPGDAEYDEAQAARRPAEAPAGDVVLLSYDEAVALLPDGDRIHTFLDAGALVGASWDRWEVLDLLRESERREVTGPAAQSYGHGLAAYREDGVPVFIKTRAAP